MAKSSPQASSVAAAMRAWNQPGFMPMLSNHAAVPASLPPRNTLLQPCRNTVTPTPSAQHEQAEIDVVHGPRLARHRASGHAEPGIRRPAG